MIYARYLIYSAHFTLAIKFTKLKLDIELSGYLVINRVSTFKLYY